MLAGFFKPYDMSFGAGSLSQLSRPVFKISFLRTALPASVLLFSLTGCYSTASSTNTGYKSHKLMNFNSARKASVPNSSARLESNQATASLTDKLNAGAFEDQNNKSKKNNTPEVSKATGALPSLSEAINKPLSPEQTEELLDEVGSNWLYGQGVGETAVTVGAIAAFPPYAILVLGNAALQVSGEEPIGLSTILPDEAAEHWTDAYDGVTSVPGRGIALAADEDFRDKETARERIVSVINKTK